MKKYQTALNVFCSLEVLSSYLSWFCSTEIAVGFDGLMIKMQKMNHLTVKV
jgi:hypothetical protein